MFHGLRPVTGDEKKISWDKKLLAYLDVNIKTYLAMDLEASGVRQYVHCRIGPDDGYSLFLLNQRS